MVDMGLKDAALVVLSIDLRLDDAFFSSLLIHADCLSGMAHCIVD